MVSSEECLSVFAAVASEVVARLVSRYEKALPHEFLLIFVNELLLMEKKKEEQQNGHFCNIITQKNFEGNFVIHKQSSFV